MIEAGPDGRNEPRIYIPGRRGSTLGTIYDWNFTTVPQPGANGRVIAQNRGKVLGGSSALNLIAWDRGTDADYNAWEELGTEGWNSMSMFAAMRQAETFQLTPEDAGITEPLGHEGPIHFLVNKFSPPQQEAFFPTMVNLGIDETFAFLDGNMTGYMHHTSNILLSNYTRSYSPAYLATAGSNLHLMINTTVSKLNLDSKACVTGVTLEDGSIVNAKKEVILSAGSLQSPQLLELSGIGNATILAAAGIDQLVDNPHVGENLQDHIRAVTAYQLRPNYTSPDIFRFNLTFAAEQLAQYYSNQTGYYDETATGYAYLTWQQVLGNDSSFVALAREAAESGNLIDQKKLAILENGRMSEPQLEIIFSDGYLGFKGYPAANSSQYGQQFFGLIAAIQHPFSRGSTHINASNPRGKPVFNPNYLTQEYDLQAVKEGAKYLRKIASTPPLSYTWTSEYEPGLDVVNTEAEWTEYAKNAVTTIWHPLGTCAMLPKEHGGVVDSKLKIYGVDRLRVVDASIIPILPSGHIQSAVYGIAERAAEMIAAQWS